MSIEELKQAFELIKSGDTDQAGAILTDLLAREPDNEYAWLALSKTCATDERRKYCLQQVLRINPANFDALNTLETLEKPAARSPARAASPAPQWLKTALPILAFILFIAVLTVAALQAKANLVPLSVKDRANAFLEQAGQLDASTDVGVNYADYSAQLEMVNSAYAALENPLPPALQAGQAPAERALEGWNLAQELWRYTQENGQFPFISSSGYEDTVFQFINGEYGCSLVEECITALFKISSANLQSVNELWGKKID